MLQLGYTLVEPPPGHPSLFAKLSNNLQSGGAQLHDKVYTRSLPCDQAGLM